MSKLISLITWLDCMNYFVISKVVSMNELLIIIGDLNKKVGDAVVGNHVKISFGGQMVRNLLEDGKYKLVKNSPRVVGGPWTGVDPSDATNKSVLSLIIVSSDLVKYIDKLEVYKERAFTPKERAHTRTILRSF